ncbi:DUF4843 domain-containing protein [Aestuariibaculum lutulentum]|uniref:DUF4843 domain-containing protein n=1 Tax=Aestuariibaculum lutulentum TaxID=2920935 RepID=A0ABS9RFQ7_9FLAO|nr:DUF4843 domain-containing protein [Aestuariibaculum lutulentum]MCH4551336.1 DUF4843 domain-containing protein [Aestuariibaculum lutulentum]
MKKIILYITAVCLSCFTMACDEDTLNTYSAKDNIYYTWPVEGVRLEGATVYPDSLGNTFAFQPAEITETVFNLKVSVQGKVVDYDREIKVNIGANSTAKQGVHFDLPEKIIFGANKASDVIPITFYRTSDMKENSYTLVLELVEGGDFSVDMKDEVIDPLTQEKRSFSVFQLTINDILRTPKFWYWYYLGDFSAKKMILLTELFGIPLDFYETTDGYEYDLMKYQGLYTQRYLNEREKAGEPILEDDGTPMIMGPNVQN